MSMNHQLYDNKVIANRFEDILNTKLETRNLMTIDNSLATAAGMKKAVHTYKYEGTVEELAMGQGNSEDAAGLVSLTKKEYEVKVQQQPFHYFDEQAMIDPLAVQCAIEKAAVEMKNHFNKKFFNCIEEVGEDEKIVIEAQLDGALTYNDVVDALALLNMEMEEGLFLLVGDDMKTDIRKDEDYKAARQGELLFSGQVGQVAGLPVVHSRMIAAGHAYIMDRNAVTCFIKKEVEVEQERDANCRRNDVYLRVVNVMAITDATRIIRLVKQA